MKKAAYLLFGMLMIIITMTACGKSEEEKQIIGTWRYESSYVSILTFNEDMTCTETVTASVNSIDVENTRNGTYEINNGTLIIYFDGQPDHLANFKFEDDKMIWANIFDDVIYIRES